MNKIKKIKFALLTVLVALFTGMFTSCDKMEDEPRMTNDELHDLSQIDKIDDDASLGLRSSDWIEFPYNPAIAVKYLLKTPRKLTENQYVFAIEARKGIFVPEEQEFYVKLYSPTGNTSYEKMTKVPQSGTTRFELRKTFSETGDYSYVYLARESSFSSYLIRLMNKGGTVSLLMIPAIQDDYANYVDVSKSSDQWRFEPKQCVSWVALKVNQMWGTQNDFHNHMFTPRLSNAVNWKQRFLNNGYSVNKSPQAGDIIWWGAYGGTGIGQNGHVGFVHKVQNGEIHYTEYNGKYSKQYSYRTLKVSKIGQAEFIHVQKKR